MLFKSIAFIAVASVLVSGSAIDLEARQTGQLATCVITTTPSNTPRDGDFVEEFTTIFIREYVADIGPDAGILTGSTSVAPPVNGVYTVTRTTGSPSLTAEETRNILRGWVVSPAKRVIVEYYMGGEERTGDEDVVLDFCCISLKFMENAESNMKRAGKLLPLDAKLDFLHSCPAFHLRRTYTIEPDSSSSSLEPGAERRVVYAMFASQAVGTNRVQARCPQRTSHLSSSHHDDLLHNLHSRRRRRGSLTASATGKPSMFDYTPQRNRYRPHRLLQALVVLSILECRAGFTYSEARCSASRRVSATMVGYGSSSPPSFTSLLYLNRFYPYLPPSDSSSVLVDYEELCATALYTLPKPVPPSPSYRVAHLLLTARA
ncbi:hypothetical protein NMY22_g14410 [Coprinellus aureogranulatus]|nr:hypothetical protein NMY22_g14410 [Coprinellus aureogranulatus]